MESSQNCLKSLKDTLLEYAVLNMDLLFTQHKMQHESTSVPTFPNNLFDEIMEKSMDMCWKIETRHLKPCMTTRDKLKWSERVLFRFFDNFTVREVSHSMRTFKTLKLYVNLQTMPDTNAFHEISEAADAIEDLDLNINLSQGFREKHKTGFMSKFGANSMVSKPLKLKRLRLELDSIDWFPFTVDPGNLTVFDLYCCKLTNSFLKTLVGFKRLVHLSLHRTFSHWVSMEEIINAVVSLKNLRFLGLWSVTELMMNKIINDMDNLNILELRFFNITDPKLLLTPRRKLKVLNFHFLQGSSAAALECLAHRIGNFESLNGLMTIISTTPNRNMYSEAVATLFRLIQNRDLNLQQLIKSEKSGIYNFRSPLRLDETTNFEQYSSTFYDILTRMTCYGFSSSAKPLMPFLNDWIKDLVSRNKNTHLANRFTRFLGTLHERE